MPRKAALHRSSGFVTMLQRHRRPSRGQRNLPDVQGVLAQAFLSLSGKLVIGGRTFRHGETAAILRPAETGAAGLMPVSLFKAAWVCNSEGYVLLD
jgi:hypothetical protein